MKNINTIMSILIILFVFTINVNLLNAAEPLIGQSSPGRDGTGSCLEIIQGNPAVDICISRPSLSVIGDKEYVFNGYYAAVSGQVEITGTWKNIQGTGISSFKFLLPDTQDRWEAFFDEFVSPIGAVILDVNICSYSSQTRLHLDDFSLRRGTLRDYASEFNPPAVQDGKSVFPIFAWVPPGYHVTYGDQAIFFDSERLHAEYALANFTLELGSGDAKAKKYGCKECTSSLNSSDTTIRRAGQDEQVWGFMGKDEPSYSTFSTTVLAERNRVKSLAPGKMYFNNLLPNYATLDQLGARSYTQYVAAYLAVVNPDAVTFDFYGLKSTGTNYTGFYANFETVRHEALSAGKVYGAILQSTSWGDGLRVPNEADMRWQAYSALVYGSKILGWFTYLDYLNLTDDRAAVLDANGNRAPLYSIIKNLNGEVINLGYTLLDLSSDGVYHTANPLPTGTTEVSSSTLMQSMSGGQWVVGEFHDIQGRKFLMLVNRDYSLSQTTTFTLKPFSPLVQNLFEISKVTSEEAAINGYDAGTRSFTMTFLPGEGRLFRLVQ